MVLACAAFRGEQFLVGGDLVYVFADPATMRSKPVPHKLRDLLQSFEAGQSMIELRLGRWDELGPAASNIRKQVFIEEQKIPPSWSTTPTRTASHSLQPLGPGHRAAVRSAPGVGKIGRWRCWHRCAAAHRPQGSRRAGRPRDRGQRDPHANGARRSIRVAFSNVVRFEEAATTYRDGAR
jgi:hypothetical protein